MDVPLFVRLELTERSFHIGVVVLAWNGREMRGH